MGTPFSHLLPGRGWRLRDASGLSIATRPDRTRARMMLPLRQLPGIWRCTLKQETPLCRKVWDVTVSVATDWIAVGSAHLCPIIKLQLLLEKNLPPESLVKLLFLFI